MARQDVKKGVNSLNPPCTAFCVPFHQDVCLAFGQTHAMISTFSWLRTVLAGPAGVPTSLSPDCRRRFFLCSDIFSPITCADYFLIFCWCLLFAFCSVPIDRTTLISLVTRFSGPVSTSISTVGGVVLLSHVVTPVTPPSADDFDNALFNVCSRNAPSHRATSSSSSSSVAVHLGGSSRCASGTPSVSMP